MSLLVLSSVSASAAVGSDQVLLAAGLLAVMAGIVQILMGVARLGMLVNFVSDAVVVGFAAGAGVQIAAGELRHLVGVEVGSRQLVDVLARHDFQWYSYFRCQFADDDIVELDNTAFGPNNNRGMREIVAYAGRKFTETAPLRGDHYGQLIVSLEAREDDMRTVEQIVDELRPRVQGRAAPASVTCCPTMGARSVGNWSENCSSCSSSLELRLKTAEDRNVSTVSMLPSCRKPNPRTSSPPELNMPIFA